MLNDILNKEDINTIFIATPHSSHAEFVIKAIKADKNVFVEKPLAINEEQLKEIINQRKTSRLLWLALTGDLPGLETIKNEFRNINEPLL